MTDVYRLTFNKPAVAQLFHAENGDMADGLKVRIEDGKAMFLPVSGSKDGDVLRLMERSRGGVEATIDGTMADDLAEALAHADGPFSILQRQGGGWLGAVAHPSDEAPSKFVPHLRVWHSGPVARPKGQIKAKRAASKPRADMNILQMFDALKDARVTVSEFDRDKRRGQPPRKVREAREMLSAFNQMIPDFIPEINEAYSILDRVARPAKRRAELSDAA